MYVYLTVFLIFAINTWCNIWTSYSLDHKSDFSLVYVNDAVH